ncbi:MAG TPA: AraC family transcriptional regulator [Allosphingosinicella sp.]
MSVLAHGRIVLWEGASLWIFKAAHGHSRTDQHSHHAIQLTFALEGDFEFRTSSGNTSGPIAAIAPDTSHEFQATGTVAMLFIDPDGSVGRSLAREWFAASPLRRIEPEAFQATATSLREAFETNRADAELVSRGKAVISDLRPAQQPPTPDPRFEAMLRFVADNLEERISLRDVARHVHLSPTRAGHLFVEHAGLPLKTYLLWRRLTRAVEAYSDGALLTEAAHGAGFADSAHFSRTFRRMFGLPAASLRLIRRD